MLLRILISTALAKRQGRLLENLKEHGLVFEAEDLWAVLREEPIDVLLARPCDLGPEPTTALTGLRASPRPPEVMLVTTRPLDPLIAAWVTILSEDLPPSTQLEIVRLVLEHASRSRRHPLSRRGAYLERTLNTFGSSSPAICRFHEEARRAAASDAPILIRGEIGTGKTWLGPVLHIESRRAHSSFRRFSCAAVEEEVIDTELFGHGAGAVPGRTRAGRGLFEKAHRGTLFLENIDRAPAAVQGRVVEALERGAIRPRGVEREVPIDVRLLGSIQTSANESSVDGAELVTQLQRRFELTSLVVPTLRERSEDVPGLAAAALERCRRRHGSTAETLSDAALEALRRHTWPGNVKEFWAVVERAALRSRGDVIELQDLPIELLAEGGHNPGGIHIEASWLADPARLPTLREVRSKAVDLLDRAYLDRLLRATRGRVGEAARRAEIDPRSLHALMRRHGLRKEDFKSR